MQLVYTPEWAHANIYTAQKQINIRPAISERSPYAAAVYNILSLKLRAGSILPV